MDGGFGEKFDGATRVIEVLADAPLALPNDPSLLTGEFVRDGGDLRIETADGGVTVLEGYFDGGSPNLMIGGALLKGVTVEKLARAPVDEADDPAAGWGSLDDGAASNDGWGDTGGGWGSAPAPAEPLFGDAGQSGAAPADLGAAILGTEGAIAEITEAYGVVEILRADGTKVIGETGTPIFEDDILSTSAEGSVGVTFLDGMSFSLGESARMVFDEFSYDPAAHSGGGVLSVVQGAFSFISGEAAHTAEDALMIETPTMTIGVRGTKVVSEIAPDGETSRIAIMAEENGRIGKIMVKTDQGETILDKPNTMVEVTSRFAPPSEQREMSSAEAVEYFGSALSVLPAPVVDYRPEMIDAGYEAAAQIAAAAQNGGQPQQNGGSEQAQATVAEAVVEPVVDSVAPSAQSRAPQTAAQATAKAAGETAGVAQSADAMAELAAKAQAAAAKSVEASQEENQEAIEEVAEAEEAAAEAAAEAAERAVNHAPTSVASNSDTAAEDVSYSFNASAVFHDADGDALTYSATLADGSPLPGWLSINESTGVLYGTPGQAFVGATQVVITANDGHGGEASATLDLTVTNTNDAPSVSTAIGATTVNEGSMMSLGVAYAFADSDIAYGDSLQYSATLADGSPLPSWLSIDPTTGVISGLPDDAQIGSRGLRVTATDESGQSASTTFNLTVAGVNDAPELVHEISDSTIHESATFSLDVTDAFTDDDLSLGDLLRYAATLANGDPLPSWLSFNQFNGTFSGTPSADDAGIYEVKVAAIDSNDGFVTTTFTLTVEADNVAPTVTASLSDAGVEAGASLSIDASSAFSDANSVSGDSLTYTATLSDGSALPDWLSIDPTTGALTGSPDDGDIGSLSLNITATDEGGLSVSTTLSVTVSQDTSELGASLSLGGDETTVNTTLDGHQYYSNVTGLADGGHVVVWQSAGQDGSGFGVYAQRFDENGDPAGTEFRVNTDTANGQTDPQIVALAGGGFVVSWTCASTGSFGDGVRAQVFDANGDMVGSEFSVNSYYDGDQNSSTITALEGGGFVISWVSHTQDSSSRGVYAQRYAADGTEAGGEFQVNTTTPDQQIEPSVASLEDGGFIVAWTSKNQDGDGDGVYMQRYDSNGDPVGGETLVNSVTVSDQNEPSVTGLEGGGYVVTWTSSGQDGGGDGVYFQRYDANGDAVGDAQLANTTTANHQFGPFVESMNDGGFVIAWSAYSQDDSGSAIVAQRFGSDGATIGDETQLNIATLNNQMDPSLAVRADGSLVAVWTDGSGANGYDVTSRVFETNAAPDLSVAGGETTVSVAASNSVEGTLSATDADGHSLVFDILSQSSGGALGTATIDQDTGAWSYTAADGASGSDEISYQVSDGHGGVDTVTITFAVGA